MLRRAGLAFALSLYQASATVEILNENKRSWSVKLPMVQQEGFRDKKWKLEGQTGWSLSSGSQDDLQMDLAFIVTTTDDGVDPTETIENDDIIIVSWVIPTNQHTEEVANYEGGVMQFYKGAGTEIVDTADDDEDDEEADSEADEDADDDDDEEQYVFTAP